MAANIEIEAKVLISQSDYEKAIVYYKDRIEKQYEQTNYYIDSDSFMLKNQGIGLRIRVANNTYTLTLKAPMAEGLLEKDQTINKQIFNNCIKNNVFPEGNIKEYILMLGFDPSLLKVLAHLTTLRSDVDDGIEGTKLSIDKNTYNGIVDYEIELEGNALEKTKKMLENICLECGVPYKDNPQSKQSRAMSTIK